MQYNPYSSCVAVTAIPNPPVQAVIPPELLNPPPPQRNGKNIFAFWDKGITNMPAYLVRNVLAWHTRYHRLGWTIYIFDVLPGSPLNIAHYIDLASSSIAPDVLRKNAVGGSFPGQHTSDLVRFPLLIKYGGLYMDVGTIHLGDLNWLWEAHISNSSSPYDFASFTVGEPKGTIRGYRPSNYYLMCGPDNPFIYRSHLVFLEFWKGKSDTNGMHAHPLRKGMDLFEMPASVTATGAPEMGMTPEAATDYLVMNDAMGIVQGCVDPIDGWDGPKYTREKMWLFSMTTESNLPMQMTAWSGERLWKLLGEKVVLKGEEEHAIEDQEEADRVVKMTLTTCWSVKLMHGFVAAMFGGDTLGMIWKSRDGSDAIPGTYADLLRYASANWAQDRQFTSVEVVPFEPRKRSALLEY